MKPPLSINRATTKKQSTKTGERLDCVLSDFKTVSELKPKIGKVITGLGTGAHLERWGYDPKIIIEKDWYEQTISIGRDLDRSGLAS